MHRHFITRASAVALASSLALAAPALAQQAAATPQAGEGASPAADGEIIVTARKRAERLLDVPVAVSALSSQQIERYSTNSLQAIASQTPQLVIGESQNQVGGSINLRGVGAGTSNPSTEQAVTLNLDGVQVSYGNAIRLGQFDLERVEVLKGPQALFFGKNSPGGIVSLLSKEPGSTFEGQVRVGYETEAKQRFIEGILSGPITENIGARLVGYYSKEDGWYRNIATPVAGSSPGPAAKSPNSEDIFLRGTLVFKSSDDRLRLKMKANYGTKERDNVGPGFLGQLAVCPFGASQVAPSTTDCKIDRYYTEARIPANLAALDPAFGDGTPYVKSKQFLGSITADYDLNDTLTLSSVTGYYETHEKSFGSFTFVNEPKVAAANDLKIKSFSEELRLASDFDGPLNFLVGGFYQDGNFHIRNPLFITVLASPLQPIAVYDQDTSAYSFFGQLRYKLTEQLELSGGGRLSRETKKLSGTINTTPFELLRPKRKFKDFSPELTLSYKPDSDLTIYASYKEGFTSGGFNTAPTSLRSPAFPTLPLRDVSFDQTTVRGGELGFKGYLADRQILFDVTAYYYKYKGLQLSKFDSVAVAQTTQNAGGSKVRGIEFNTVVRPSSLKGLEMRAAVSYNKANYTDFIGGCYTGQSIAAGCNLVPRNPALAPSTFGTAANPYTSQNQTGQQIARAPKWTTNIGATYEHELGGDMGFSLSSDAKYTSSYVTQIEAAPGTRQRGYWELAANVSLYGGYQRGWNLALIGRNLTNEIVRISGGSPALVGGGTGTATVRPIDIFGSVNQPRAIVLQLTLKSSLLGK